MRPNSINISSSSSSSTVVTYSSLNVAVRSLCVSGVSAADRGSLAGQCDFRFDLFFSFSFSFSFVNNQRISNLLTKTC